MLTDDDDDDEDADARPVEVVVAAADQLDGDAVAPAAVPVEPDAQVDAQVDVQIDVEIDEPSLLTDDRAVAAAREAAESGAPESGAGESGAPESGAPESGAPESGAGETLLGMSATMPPDEAPSEDASSPHDDAAGTLLGMSAATPPPERDDAATASGDAAAESASSPAAVAAQEAPGEGEAGEAGDAGEHAAAAAGDHEVAAAGEPAAADAPDPGETLLDTPIDADDIAEELDAPEPSDTPIPPPPKLPPLRAPGSPPPRPPPRPVAVVPPRPPPGFGLKVPPVGPRPPMPPPPRASGAIQIPSAISNRSPDAGPDESDAAAPQPRTRPPSAPPPGRGSAPALGSSSGAERAPRQDLSEGGVEVSTVTPNIVVDVPLEAHLDSPTVIDRALAELGDSGSEQRSEAMATELEATTDAADAALLAYELGELYERRLADEARAIKAYGRALTLDPSLRANLWAIRRVFYRRALWPNLIKLISTEISYARDDLERADLLVEKARVANRMADFAEARSALEEAATIAPQHQGALLALERAVARAGDVPALLDVWERLADAIEHPARKVSYWLEVGRAAAADDYARAKTAFEQASTLAADDRVSAERVARERLRVTEEHGTPEDVVAAIDVLATLLLATFGPAGPSETPVNENPDRAAAIRRELVALRRRQAQLVRADAPERAWDVLQQAHAMSAGEPIVMNDLTELAEELGRYEDLAELVQSWQAVEGDEGRAMVLSIRRADALLRGGRGEQARALLASLEASSPGFIVLTSAAERDALGRGDVVGLARTYLAAAQAAQLGSWLGPGQPPAPDPGAAAALYVQAAELLAYEVAGSDQPEAATALDEARSALGQALEVVPGFVPAHEALIELADATGDLADGLDRLKQAARAAEGDAARAIYDRAIRFARSHGDLEAVLELERAAAIVSPDDTALRWRIESTLAQLGRDEDRAHLLAEIAASEADPTRRGTALLAAARLRERGGAVELATELYRQVLALWPDDTFARESLVDLLRAQERWGELVSERRAEARGLPDGDAARRALREASWVLEVRIGDTATAAQVYEEWLQRIPEDRTALEGLARCRAELGDRPADVAARRRLAELEPSPENQWLLGRALEEAQQLDDAVEVFRALAIQDEPSVATSSAAFALADLAAIRGDTVLRVEATAALAGRTSDARLGAALAEDSGWMYALVLEDFDRAAQSFDAAITLEPARRGALLGSALVAARRADPSALSAAYDGLAAAVEMPEAAAALHLRAAAMAAASGDLELANQRVAAARAHAPDDTSALLVTAETLALPFVDQDAGDEAVDPLLARAEVLEMRGALADDPVARASWELDRAEALELAGRLREAAVVVVAVLQSHPTDVRALEAMRRMAKRAHDDIAWAQASYELARVLGDPAAKLALLRDAASVLDDRDGPGAAERALPIYRRILQVDPGAPELERLLELLRERAEIRGLVTALTERLTWLEAEHQDIERDHQMVPLLLERATVLHGLGDQDAAMADLDALLDRSARHVEALRFRADLAFQVGEVEQAVELWRRCVAAETRPQRRKDIELRLAQVLAENVNDLAGAIENLESVVDGAAGTGDEAPLREQLLGLCLRASDWERATRELRSLARLRPSPQEKARDELRLGLMLRDRLNDRAGARLAFERARSFDPLNLDVVRELAELLEPAARAQVLAAAAASFRASIVQNPQTAVLYDRLAQITGWQSDVDARWVALVGLEALGTPSVDQRQVLEQGRAKLTAPAQIKIDAGARKQLRGEAIGALVDLWRAIAPAVQVATGVDAAKLGFARGDRLALKKLGERYAPLASALAAFEVTEVEIYISASRGGIARALAAETPILCVGSDIAAAQTSQQRWLLGRVVATLAEGVMTLADLREVELGWTFAAALRACDVAVPPGLAAEIAGEDASIVERARILKKELSRRARGVVQQLVQQRAGELVDVAGFRRNAIAIGNRAGLLWSGDLGVTLAQLDVGRGGKALTDSPHALELAAWSVSDEHVRLRERFGVALKGIR